MGASVTVKQPLHLNSFNMKKVSMKQLKKNL